MSNPIRICEKAGSCVELATHVLIYINKTTFQPILEKPKGYCYRHALYMQTTLGYHENMQTRIYTVREWMQIADAYKQERDLIDRH